MREIERRPTKKREKNIGWRGGGDYGERMKMGELGQAVGCLIAGH
jgi:hypothetical protein